MKLMQNVKSISEDVVVKDTGLTLCDTILSWEQQVMDVRGVSNLESMQVFFQITGIHT